MITAPLRDGGAVQIARPVSETHDVLDVLRTRLVLIALTGIALAALAAWLVMRRATRPIERLTETAEHIAATQDLGTPIPVRGDDEVGRLAASFNTMLIALDTSREQQQRLVVDASHELRTPLTAVRTNIDFLGHATTLDAEQRAQLIAETRLELDELTNLVSEMVELATDVRSEEPVEPVPLAEVADDVAARFRRRTGHEIVVDADGAGVVEGRRAMLDRAVSNLVDNAVEVQPRRRAGDVTVRGTTHRGRRPRPRHRPEDRERVFDRFYRPTSARTLPGSGLGLVDRRRRSRRSTAARSRSSSVTAAAPSPASAPRPAELRRASTVARGTVDDPSERKRTTPCIDLPPEPCPVCEAARHAIRGLRRRRDRRGGGWPAGPDRARGAC